MLNFNGLIMRTVTTDVPDNSDFGIDSYECLTEMATNYFQKSAFVVVYLDYKVMIGKFENKEFIFYGQEKFEPKYMQRIRVFDEDQELFIWKSGINLYRKRVRIDGIGNGCSVVDAEQVLWGTFAEDKGSGWTLLREKRGAKLFVPLSGVSIDERKNRVKLKTRNYIGYNEIGQAGYIDCRFMSLY